MILETLPTDPSVTAVIINEKLVELGVARSHLISGSPPTTDAIEGNNVAGGDKSTIEQESTANQSLMEGETQVLQEQPPEEVVETTDTNGKSSKCYRTLMFG